MLAGVHIATEISDIRLSRKKFPLSFGTIKFENIELLFSHRFFHTYESVTNYSTRSCGATQLLKNVLQPREMLIEMHRLNGSRVQIHTHIEILIRPYRWLAHPLAIYKLYYLAYCE